MATAMLLRKNLLVCILIVGLMLLAGCGTKSNSPGNTTSNTNEVKETKSSQNQPVNLRWGTITAGGAWQVIGNAMLEDVKKANSNITGSTLPSTTTGNVMGVHQGKFDIAFSIADTTAAAWNGEGYFKQSGKIDDIREVAALYPQSSHIVVWADSNINSIADLKGKRVSPGAKGLSSDVEFQRLLKAYGMSLSDVKISYLSFDDASQQMIDGHLEALVFATVPPPYAPVVSVGSQKQIKLLEIPDDKIAEMTKYQGVQAYELPAGTYKGIDKPVKGIMSRSHIIVRKDMPDDVVYNIVKSLAENFPRYKEVLASMKYTNAEDMATDVGIPMHPGALKYYKEKGWIK